MSRSFFDQIKHVRKGGLLEDCGDELRKVVKSVNDTGKAAKLVIEITVKPASKGQGAYIVSDKVEAKLPKLPSGETIMFGTPEDNLVANNPSQGDLPLREVTQPGVQSADLKQAGVEG